MTPKQAERVGKMLVTAREKLGWSTTELAKRAGLDYSGLWRIEHGQICEPKLGGLRAICAALHLRTIDVFTVGGLIPNNELPSLRACLHAKYHDLPDSAMQEVETCLDAVSDKYDIDFDR